jgi:predicted dehydrogenase
VLVAKPMAVDLPTATAMVELAGRHGVALAVAQQMRYFPCFLALREAVRSRRYGAVRAVRVRMALDGRGWTPGSEWRLAMADPLLLEAGIHHFDLVRWCLDTEVADVRAVSWNPSDSPFHGDASVSAVLRTREGAGVDYSASFAPREEPVVRFDSGWTVFCEGGLLTVRDGGLYVDGVPTEVGSTDAPASLEDLNALLLREWLDSRAEDVRPHFDGADNLKSLAVMQAAIDSTREAVAP